MPETLAIFVLCVCGSASGGLLNFNSSNTTANGTAVLNGNSVQLVNNNPGGAGSVVLTNPFTFSPLTSFRTSFSYQISNNGTQVTNEFSPYEGNGGGFSLVLQGGGGSPTYLDGGDGAQIRVHFDGDEGGPQNSSQLVVPHGTVAIEENGGGGPFFARSFNLQNNFSLAGVGPYDLVTGTATVTYDSVTQIFALQTTDSVGGNASFSTPFNLFGVLDTDNNVFQPPPFVYFGFNGGPGLTSANGLSQVVISNVQLSLNEGALPTSAPEPQTWGMVAIGLFGMGWARFQRRRN